MKEYCTKHGVVDFTEPVEGKRGSLPRCLPCVAEAVERKPEQFVLTLGFFARIKPLLKNGYPKGLKVL